MPSKPGITVQPCGLMPDGRQVEQVVLTNAAGCRAAFITYGAILKSLTVPDRSGRPGDVVLGFDSPQSYLGEHPYFGAVIGRSANRIAHGRFQIGSKHAQVSVNRLGHHLHGGRRGFDKVLWSAEAADTPEGPRVVMRYRSPDGEEGYPGNLDVQVACTWTHANELRMEYAAVPDQDTLVNLTHHSYFNLAGSGDILDHRLRILASRYTPVDPGLIPTGELRQVSGTAFDFLKPRAVGARIQDPDPQLGYGPGYDHNWVLDPPAGLPGPAADLFDPQSGRTLELWTTQPGLQFYSGNFLDGSLRGKDGTAYARHAGLCLEAQHFPDAPNHAHFPSTVVKRGESYRQVTSYRFGTR